MDELIKIFFI